ncbi:peptidyl-prolyl cis-trans isomerase [Tumebacillus lipolyticus]|uniref:peptidylprolyl isomerase n=1 Tax=Tumebacillus lipolyticus TaxID=1280370 RepID=A0ABW5A198_9BACL
MKKLVWLRVGGLLLFIGSAVLLYAALFYNPLLFSVEKMTLRKTEWEQLRPSLFAGASYDLSDERDLLERRSLEELVLHKGRELGITADETAIEQQLKQLGDTSAERNQTLQEMQMTEEDAKNNYRRALIGFEVKKRITSDLAIQEGEMEQYYRENKEQFFVPEFRTIRYIRAKVDDLATRSQLQAVTADSFQRVLEQLSSDPNDRMHSWEELISQGAFAQNTSDAVAEKAFHLQLNKLTGPIQDGEWNYWFLIEKITTPYQQPYLDVRQKIHDQLYQSKQSAQFRAWLESQKEPVDYVLNTDNLTASRWSAFWHDLPINIRKLW